MLNWNEFSMMQHLKIKVHHINVHCLSYLNVDCSVFHIICVIHLKTGNAYALEMEYPF
jgi:hypothetical protein